MLRILVSILLTLLCAIRVDAGPTTSATTQAMIPADQSTPRGALRVLAAAMDAGDGPKIRAVLKSSNPQEEAMVEALVKYHDAVAKFGKAAVDAFGPEDARKLTGDQAAAQAASLEALQAMPEEISGDTALVGADKPTQIRLSRVDGKWMVPVGLLAQGVEAEKVQKVVDDMLVRAKVFEETTAEITGGEKYKTAEDASQGLQLKLMKAAMNAAGPATQPTTRPAAPPPQS